MLRADHLDAAREIRRDRGDDGEQPELDPQPDRHRVVVTKQQVGEVRETDEDGDERRAGRGHQHRRHRDDRDIERPEIALRPAGEVHDGGHQRDIEQRLQVEERASRLALLYVGMPVRGPGKDHRAEQHDRRDENVERRDETDAQRRGEIDRDGHRDPPQVDEAEQVLGTGHRGPLGATTQPAHGTSLMTRTYTCDCQLNIAGCMANCKRKP